MTVQAPLAQLVVERPDRSRLIQGVPSWEHLEDLVAKLAPLVPHDAVWFVAGPDFQW